MDFDALQSIFVSIRMQLYKQHAHLFAQATEKKTVWSKWSGSGVTCYSYLRNCTEVVANSLRLAGVATIAVKGFDAMFHPPTANNVFKLGFFILRSLNLLYLLNDIYKSHTVFLSVFEANFDRDLDSICHNYTFTMTNIKSSS